ncbi:MAG: E2F-associated phosphoprotein [Podila humilis]|nr:MAG: E2F-associated phosphoprotein [Podila humilis]
MCLTQLCFDCQRHELYTHQYRAMFVEHCRTIETEVLRFAKEAKRGKQAKASELSIPSSEPEFKPSPDDEPDALYHPVVCEICNTKVALIDGDEVYHFFNVIPSPV